MTVEKKCIRKEEDSIMVPHPERISKQVFLDPGSLSFIVLKPSSERPLILMLQVYQQDFLVAFNSDNVENGKHAQLRKLCCSLVNS